MNSWQLPAGILNFIPIRRESSFFIKNTCLNPENRPNFSVVGFLDKFPVVDSESPI